MLKILMKQNINSQLINKKVQAQSILMILKLLLNTLLKALIVFDDMIISLFIGQSYFFNDGAQLYLIFRTLYHTLKRLEDTEKIVS